VALRGKRSLRIFRRPPFRDRRSSALRRRNGANIDMAYTLALMLLQLCTFGASLAVAHSWTKELRRRHRLTKYVTVILQITAATGGSLIGGVFGADDKTYSVLSIASLVAGGALLGNCMSGALYISVFQEDRRASTTAAAAAAATAE
jgi:hypothetical protein